MRLLKPDASAESVSSAKPVNRCTVWTGTGPQGLTRTRVSVVLHPEDV